MKGVSLVSISTFAALAAAHPQGLWWGTDTCYPSPENTDNQCLESQKTGFDWSELANGDNWTFEGFRFTGFSPKNACNSSGGKCIMGKLNRDDGYTLQMDAVDAPFSVRKFHLSTSRKTDVLITYELADGSSCRQIAFSTPEGHDVSNDQCGGAVSVKFMLPEESKFGECDFNIHEINFDCSGGPKSPPQPNPSSSVATIPPHLATHSSTILEIPSTPVLHTPPPTSEIQQVTPTVEGPPHSEVHESTFTVWTTSTITVTKCPPSATSCPAHSNGIVTSTLVGSTTVYPSGPHEVTTTAQPISTVTPALPSSPVVPPPQCPKLVPKCINTWLSIPKCDSNGDAACFCPSSEFTGKVQSCIHAWGTSEKEKESALSYFAGICAPYVPKNPAIIDLVPSGTSSNGPPAQTRVVPFTTLPVSVQTTTIPPTPEVPLTTITWSSHTFGWYFFYFLLVQPDNLLYSMPESNKSEYLFHYRHNDYDLQDPRILVDAVGSHVN
ncbi:hypothetical protein N7532_003315 [Penicillium argentinense]|uniref:CFEM domain-containing protein n=1 Tax=Penicillium argentinense TaxID=1131581 RepID=A0A9W9FM68_9EURO|nr:uncharacterized protein N7532_003315 [Penicillium argentinense]KAJ5102786.1 hypothetical protein N7532_003315 [Penicillium argentinense]